MRKATSLIKSDILKHELFDVATFNFLPVATEKLETQNLTKDDKWKIFNDALSCLDGFAREKFAASLGKNLDIKSFITKIIPEIQLKSLYAPLVSVDVEHLFSQYKLLLSYHRHNLL